MDVQNEMKPYVIGLDLGGTNSVFGIVDSRGDIKVTTAIKTQAYDDVNDYVKAAVEALQIIIDQVGGIGKIKAMDRRDCLEQVLKVIKFEYDGLSRKTTVLSLEGVDG